MPVAGTVASITLLDHVILGLVTTNLTRAARRSARLATPALVTSLVVLGAPAFAKPPEGWSNPASVDTLHLLMVLFGFPLIIFAVVALLVVVPGLAKGERLGHSNEPVREENWLGGPRPAHELESAEHTGGTGGASGSW